MSDTDELIALLRRKLGRAPEVHEHRPGACVLEAPTGPVEYESRTALKHLAAATDAGGDDDVWWRIEPAVLQPLP